MLARFDDFGNDPEVLPDVAPPSPETQPPLKVVDATPSSPAGEAALKLSMTDVEQYRRHREKYIASSGRGFVTTRDESGVPHIQEL